VPEPSAARTLTPRTRPAMSAAPPSGAARQRRVWNRRASRWADSVTANDGLRQVVDAVVGTTLDLAGPRMGTVVDLGSGSGQLLLPLAPHADRAVAIDVSDSMLRALADRAQAAGVTNLVSVVRAIEDLDLPPASVDVVVSNYALHHLRDRDKQEVLQRAVRWLRPGGWLVIGDMMLGRGADPADRAVIAGKLRALAAQGPGGWWRIAKNAVRFTVRVQERPVTAARWHEMAERAGFEAVSVRPVVHEAAVLVARAPSRPRPSH
jgi:ubiquinone/menaquinone biosynthesis C-methylase UbiE